MVLLALPASLVLLQGLQTLTFGFVYDDESFVLGAGDMLQTDPMGILLTLTRPIKVFTFAFDEWIFRGQPWGYHLHSVLWASLNAALAAALAFKLSAHRQMALLTGILFAVHPVHVETVANIANRKDLLAFAFGAGSLLLLAEPFARRELPGAVRTALATLLLLGAILSKEIVGASIMGIIGLLGAGAAFQSWRSNTAPPRSAFLYAGILVIGFTWVIVLFLPAPNQIYAPERIKELSGGAISGSMDWVLRSVAGGYQSLQLLFFPARLCADHALPGRGPLPTLQGIFAVGILAGAPILGFRLLARQALLGLGLVMLTPTLLPVMNLLPLSSFFVAERYLYLPSLASVFIVAGLLQLVVASLPRSRRQPVLVISFMVLALTGLAASLSRTQVWKDDYSLWSRTVSQNRDSWRAHNNLGRALRQRGAHVESEHHFRMALKLAPAPEMARLQANVGLSLQSQAQYGPSQQFLRGAVRASAPDEVGVFSCMLGSVLLDVGKIEEAESVLRRAILHLPMEGEGAAWCRLAHGLALLSSGRDQEALEEIAASAAMAPDAARIQRKAEGFRRLVQDPCEILNTCTKLRLQNANMDQTPTLRLYCSTAKNNCASQRGKEVLIDNALAATLSAPF